jgi:hypothetical protein
MWFCGAGVSDATLTPVLNVLSKTSGSQRLLKSHPCCDFAIRPAVAAAEEARLPTVPESVCDILPNEANLLWYNGRRKWLRGLGLGELEGARQGRDFKVQNGADSVVGMDERGIFGASGPRRLGSLRTLHLRNSLRQRKRERSREDS